VTTCAPPVTWQTALHPCCRQVASRRLRRTSADVKLPCETQTFGESTDRCTSERSSCAAAALYRLWGWGRARESTRLTLLKTEVSANYPPISVTSIAPTACASDDWTMYTGKKMINALLLPIFICDADFNERALCPEAPGNVDVLFGPTPDRIRLCGKLRIVLCACVKLRSGVLNKHRLAHAHSSVRKSARHVKFLRQKSCNAHALHETVRPKYAACLGVYPSRDGVEKDSANRSATLFVGKTVRRYTSSTRVLAKDLRELQRQRISPKD
jgi:hypothetical protein